MADELKFYLSTMIENLTEVGNSNTQRFKSSVQSPIEEIPKLANLINAHATKLGLVYKPPIAESSFNACRAETDIFCKNVMLLMSVINQVREDLSTYSKVFVTELSGDFKSLIEAAVILLNELVKLIGLENDDGAQRLVGVGLAWEATETIVRTIKLGNSGVLRNKLKICNKVIVDALEELNEWLENPVEGGGESYDINELLGLTKESVPMKLKDEEEEEEMAAEDVVKCGKKWSKKIGLVKLLVGLLNRSIPNSKYTVKFSKSLDAINDNRMKLNEFVDDIIASLVYDSDNSMAEEAGVLLDKEVKGLVELAKKINDEKKVKWIDSWVIKYYEN